MTLYAFRCSHCGRSVESTVRDPAPTCADETHNERMGRDYKAEGVGLGSGVKVSRDGTDHDQADLFLPTAADLAVESDPTGEKSLREWNETHGPKDGAKRAIRPQVSKKVW